MGRQLDKEGVGYQVQQAELTGELFYCECVFTIQLIVSFLRKEP